MDNIEQISRATGIPIRELNRLNQDTWYHGTTMDAADNIEENGVIASYNEGNMLDFGMGFYLTNTEEKANNYISRVPVVNEAGDFCQRESWSVLEFSFNPFKYIFVDPHWDITYKCFPKHNEEFAKFVLFNRLHNVFNENPHKYDIIWGVMSDGMPDQIVIDYYNHDLTYDEAVQKLMKPNSMKQLYLGKQSLCNRLVITNRIDVQKGGQK